ncbi:MAG: DMT family transporter [Methylocystis sp.]|jgi:drug/metabolite transporter (DMT)-like permease|nr:DMT family transporter [Methylocystis sp.]MCA3585862.1 DMT family transporter [Methylocystis sp.]MCA3586628.1 DMT family transporter [Methylocystis sp.]MCA3591804.1 DMT family transporter [Methylocystis sp.]
MNPDPPAGDGSRLIAILLILAASLIFAVSDSVAKLVVGPLPAVELMWIRSIVVVLITLPAVLWRKGPGVLRAKQPLRQILRGACIFISSIAFLTGLIYLPLADASAINFIWPLLITIFSVFMLGEKVGIRRAGALLAGCIGMLIIIRPGSGAFQPAAVFPLIAAAVWAFASVLTRMMAAAESPETTLIWSAAIALLCSTLILPFVWVTPTWREIGFGVFIGLSSAAAHSMIVFAFDRAPASALAPFSYMQLVWAALCSLLIFDAVPDRWVILGGAIIAASGIYTAHRERVRMRELKAVS